MRLKNIVTMDNEIIFENVEILNIKNEKQLDKAIQNNKILNVEENGVIYNLNSSYIIFYQLWIYKGKVGKVTMAKEYVFDKENVDIIKQIVAEATENAVRQIEKQRQDKIKGRYDKRLRNTNMLLRNYNNFKKHITDATYTEEIKEKGMDEELDYDKDIDDLFINSILKTKKRTEIMIKHIDNCIEYYTYKCLASNKDDVQRRIQVIKMLYINKEPMTYEEISEELNCSTKTIDNTRKVAIKELSVLFFGIDGVKLEWISKMFPKCFLDVSFLRNYNCSM